LAVNNGTEASSNEHSMDIMMHSKNSLFQ